MPRKGTKKQTKAAAARTKAARIAGEALALSNAQQQQQQQQRGASRGSENEDAPTRQLLREASSVNNTPTKRRPEETTHAIPVNRLGTGGGKLRRPSGHHGTSTSSRYDPTGSTVVHLKQFASSPLRSRVSDNPYGVPDSPAKQPPLTAQASARSASRTTTRSPVGPRRKRAAESLETEDARQSKKPRTTQKPSVRSGGRHAPYHTIQAVEEAPARFSMAVPSQFPRELLEEVAKPEESDRILSPVEDAVQGAQEERPAITMVLNTAIHDLEGDSDNEDEGEEQSEGEAEDVVEVDQPDAVLETLDEPQSIVRTQNSDDDKDGEDEDDNDRERVVDDPQEENYDVLPLFGHGPLLGQIFRANQSFKQIKECKIYYNRQGVPLRKISPIARTIHSSARKLVHALEEDAAGDDELETDFLDALYRILAMVDKLNPDKAGRDGAVKVLVRHVHIYVMPCLVDLLQGLVDHVCKRAQAMGLQRLEATDVEVIEDIINCLLSLEVRSKKWNHPLKKTDPLIKEFRETVLNDLHQVGKAAQMQLKKLEQQEHAKTQYEMQVEAMKQWNIEHRHRVIQAELARDKKARVSKLLFDRQRAERSPQLRLALHCLPLKPPEMISARTRNIDANGEQFERVGMFGHSQREEPFYELRDGEEPWTDLERQELMSALQAYHGPNLWENTFRYFCRPDDPLRMRTASEMLRQAKYMRDVFVRSDEEDEDGPIDGWLLEIPDLDLIDFI